MEKLASAKRVNSASDDVAASQIIQSMSAQITGNQQSVRNAYDGISVSQVAEGALAGISDDVNRIRELSVQAGNGMLNADDRQSIQNEIAQLQGNIGNTISSTEFNGNALLSSNGQLGFQTGANQGQVTDVQTFDVTAGIASLLSVDVTATGGVNSALNAADTALDYVGEARGTLGASQNQFASVARQLVSSDITTQAARSRINDTDFAKTASELAASNVLQQSAIAMQAQANQQQGQVLALLS
jgi:flagellin